MSARQYIEHRILELNRGQHIVFRTVRVERDMHARNSFNVSRPDGYSCKVDGISAAAAHVLNISPVQ
jgi:hypothetical protein